jgi:hypothetical protein
MNTEHINPRIWGKPVGKTQAGRDVYRSVVGNYAVEQYGDLRSPTDEEMDEIRRRDNDPTVPEEEIA